MPEQQQTDLVLPMGVHAMVLDLTKGEVSVYVGPANKTLSQQEDTVILSESGRFRTVRKEEAIRNNVLATKGQYVVLKHPHKEDKYPSSGGASKANPETLRMGEIVNIPGPVAFAPWPMQEVKVVDGHHLKSNEYLLVRIYDEEAARKNWARGTVKLVTEKPGEEKLEKVEKPESAEKFLGVDPAQLVIGQLLLIKGTHVSFYIPPTGVEVVPDRSVYVRQAETLERLEYCLLVDEDGNKRYVKGPSVVFPEPTETFKLNDEGQRKSRAYELTEISGLHVKVIQDYVDHISLSDPRLPHLLKDGRLKEVKVEGDISGYEAHYKEGEELFITGKDQPLYYPRIEHAILKYGAGRTRYHAVEIPEGEARYVMNRLTGAIRLEKGPSMFLPDPRFEVIVKRVLTQGECEKYYPGNARVKQYNSELERLSMEISDQALLSMSPSIKTGHVQTSTMGSLDDVAMLRSSRASDTIDRGKGYTPPRTLIIDTKYEGAVQVSPYTGYAIQIVNKKGDRKTVVGPKTVLLEFDERLETLLLSTGTPKDDEKLLKTVYLRIANNAVSDILVVKTKDLVPFKLTLKYLVNFLDTEEYRNRWYNVDNYVQHLVDHFRSLLNNYARGLDAEEFYSSASDLIRNRVLGEKNSKGKRSLATFEENGMQVYDLDVINVEILDEKVRVAMQALQTSKLFLNLDKVKAEAELEFKLESNRIQTESLRSTEELNINKALAEYETQQMQMDLQKRRVETQQEIELKKLESSRAQSLYENETEALEKKAEMELDKAVERAASILEEIRLTRAKADDEHKESLLEAHLARELRRISTYSESDVKRLQAVQPELVANIRMLAGSAMMSQVSGSFGDLAILRDSSIGGVVDKLFKGTPLEPFIKNMETMLVSQPEK